MGHDITAYRPGVDREAVYQECVADQPAGNSDEDRRKWLDGYDAYTKQTQIAYNRRSAGNPLNQVLYLALGVMDDAYAGCSGDGSTLDISLQQLTDAREILGKKDFANMAQERNMSHDLMDMFKRAGANIVEADGPPDTDVSQEKKFVDDCIAYLEEAGVDSLEVCFG